MKAGLFPKASSILDKFFSTWDTGFCESEIGFKNKTKTPDHIVAEANAAAVSILVDVKVKHSGLYYSLDVLRKSL